MMRTGTLGPFTPLNLFAMAIEMACSLKYQLEMSSRTVSALMALTRILVTLVVDEK
jgi:hypothetical protein